MSIDLDIGPLSWVKGEIDLSLERASAALKAHLEDPSGQGLANARVDLHQANGALVIVGLDGITEFSESIEQLVTTLLSGGTPWSETAATAALSGIAALRGYLDGLMGGEPNQPLKLMPTYSALLVARGQPEPEPSALFFPDMTQRPPRRQVEPPVLIPETLAARLKMARLAYERGLLKWIKGEARGIKEMKTAVAMIEATRTAPSGRAFWWIAQGFFEALAANGIAEAHAAKKLAMQIGAQIKKLSEGADQVPDRLTANALYLVATATEGAEQVGIVRSAYRLNDLIPRSATAQADAQRPIVRRLRELVTGAKDDWNKLCAGSAAALPPFHDKATSLAARGAELGQAAITELTAALSTLADALRRDPTRHNDAMALEVATALLLTDTALENFEHLDAEFDHQANVLAERLAALLRGDALAPFEIPQLDAISQRAQERLLLATVAREISSNLGTVEQALDSYFRDTSKQATLAPLIKPLKQVEGALIMLGQERAVDVVRECVSQISALSSGSAGGEIPSGNFEELAKKLSALSYFVEQLESGARPDLDALLDPEAAKAKLAEVAAQDAVPPSPTFLAESPTPAVTEPATSEADVPPSPEVPVVELELPVVASETQVDEISDNVSDNVIESVSDTVSDKIGDAVTAATDDEDNDEMLEIFLEEAREVLGTIAAELPQLHAQPDQASSLTTLRRSFHTLKGSGRMVGLMDLGEAGWSVEQVLNHWIQTGHPANGALLSMLDDAAELFSAWIEQLAEDGGKHRDASALTAACVALLTVAEPASESVDDAAEGSEEIETSTDEIAVESIAVEAATEEPAGEEPVIAELAGEESAPTESSTDLPVEHLIEAPVEPSVEAPVETSAADLVAELEAREEASAEAALAAAELEAAEIMAGAAVTTHTSEIQPPEAIPADEPAVEIESAEVYALPAPPPVVIGDVQISPALYGIFLNEATDRLAAIQSEVGNGRVPSNDLIRATHTLAGISGTTGIQSIRHLARALELALERLAQADAEPTEDQRFVLARCAGALEGMLGAVAERRLPSSEAELQAALDAMQPIAADTEITPDVETAETTAEPAPEAEQESAEEIAEPLPEPVVAPAVAAIVAPAAPAITAAAETPESLEERRAQRMGDEIDEQLLPIFLEESVDLMQSISEGMRNWRADPTNAELSRKLQRDLHTIKGSARMVGAMGCGELYHSMESRIEQAVAMRAVSSEMLDSLDVSVDRGIWIIDRLRRGESTAIPAQAAAEVQVSVDTAAPVKPATAPAETIKPDETPAEQTAKTTAVKAPIAQVHLRVRADLVDKLVNETGEVAIARARVEGEMRALKLSLLELTENVIRLRSQVREIEIQAEGQMASQQEQSAHAGAGFDPLEFDRFTRFQELTRMMAESVNDVSTVQHGLLKNLEGADAALLAQARLNSDLSQRLMSVRMVPFESLAERLHRVVRQAAKESGKRANLDIKGGQTGIDRSVLETITGPLEHLLRNAVAHGLEVPSAREAAGKAAQGEIALSLAQEGNDVVITLIDDGAGLNLERIRARGIERGLLPPGAGMETEAEKKILMNLIFESGFSTAETLSAIAGRGVGMDVVRSETESLGGRIEINTTAGQGSSFRLYLPLTLAVSQAVIIQSGTRHFAVPSSMIEQASEMKPEAIIKVRGNKGIEHLGRFYPYHYLAQLLGDSAAQPAPARRHWLLLVKGGSERLALEIDGMVSNQEIIVKTLGAQLARVPGMAGATVLGNGEIALILNPIALAARVAALHEGEALSATEQASVRAPAVDRRASGGTVMVVDDSLTVRKITGRLLGRQGYHVVTAKDGVDALEQLIELHPDVMLVDIEMPRMDGFELARNIRADSHMKDIPIIMITSRSADKHRNYAKEIGVNHYMGKPYDEEELLRLIASYARTGGE